MFRKQVLPMEYAFVEGQDFEAMARDAGFHVAQLYGNYDREPFDPRRSWVMIWVLKKGGAQSSAAADRMETGIPSSHRAR
jgi:hypothetical protein